MSSKPFDWTRFVIDRGPQGEVGAFIVRDAVESDLDSIAGLLRELGEHAHTTLELDPCRMRNLFGIMATEPGRYRNLVACAGDSIVGYISAVSYVSLFHRKGTVLINELVVTARQRHAGIGRALVREIVSMAARDGMDEVEVGTEKTNLTAIEFYRRAGFDEEYVLLGQELPEMRVERGAEGRGGNPGPAR